MLSTNARMTQTLDPTTGVARALAVTATAYPCTAINVWSSIVRKPMPKVDFHADRWPLPSTS